MSKSQKLLPFEGLRGIAACVVVLGHLRLTFWPGSSAELRHSLESLPPLVARGLRAAIDGPLNGNFSVWLFWIMSAFVLALQFFLRVKQAPATGAAHDYLEEACLRRYPRLLLPVCGSVAFAYAIHAAGWMRNVTVAHALGDLKGTGWLAGFYRFPASALGAVKSAVWESFFAFDMATTYNSNLWTMEKEFYGSLFLFAFLGVLGHRSSRLFAYPIVALVLYQLNLQWLNTFLAGIALCDAYVNRERLTRRFGRS